MESFVPFAGWKPLHCLLAFAGITGLEVFAVGSFRGLLVLKGRRSNSFPSESDHGGPEWYKRLRRAHVNCVENLPLFASVILANSVLGARGADLDFLARLYLTARIGQTTTHIASTAEMAVNVRFAFFVTQLVCLGLMGAATFKAI